FSRNSNARGQEYSKCPNCGYDKGFLVIRGVTIVRCRDCQRKFCKSCGASENECPRCHYTGNDLNARDYSRTVSALGRTRRPAFRGPAHGVTADALGETHMPAIAIRWIDSLDARLIELTDRPSSTSARH